MRLLFSVVLDVFLTFAVSLTVVFSIATDSPSYQMITDAHVEAEDVDVETCSTTAELTNQILGELNSAVGAVKKFSSDRDASCVPYLPSRCNML